MKIKKENILLKFMNRDKTQFWREISKMNTLPHKNIVSIDGKNVPDKITEIFDNKYRNILDNANCQTENTCSFSGRVFTEMPKPLIAASHISVAIEKLNTGVGWDGYHSNLFKFSGPIFRNLLGKFMNMMLSHSYVPSAMSHGEIRPVIKSKIISKYDSDNYRPVMNSCMILKIFEYCLLPYLTKSLKLSSRQFGYRKNTGCLPAIALVKETIDKYNSENSNVHCAVVDLSKAFDCVNKNILFEKLRCTSLNRSIVDVLNFMYCNTSVNTVFNGVGSNPWQIGNGVRQGGILSPLLFSFYVNEAMETISDMKVGCSINGYKTNIIGYADDLLCMAPTIEGLQMIIDQLYLFLDNLCLNVNAGKCKHLIFKSKRFKSFPGDPAIFLNGVRISRESEYKYLGVMLNGDADKNSEINRVMESFLKQFNGLYSKFHYVTRDVLRYLFKTYTSSFYGIELWYDKIPASLLDKMSVTYHKAVKRISGHNVWDSNHDACETAGVYVFKHLLAKRMLCFWHNLTKSKSPCLGNLRYFFRHSSSIFLKLNKLFHDVYSVDILDNPLCAIISRIGYVQRTEPRSHYVPA